MTLFGGFGLKIYKPHLQRQVEFSKRLEFGETDVCIIGVDSTYPFDNRGNFTSDSKKNFEKHISDLKTQLGDPRFERAIKVVLLHHHPMPTLSSVTERMLYMKNAGVFLNLLMQERVNLVLHGRQHDPCYLSLNYNVGGHEKGLVILSAGTATKVLHEGNENPFSASSQLYLVTIDGSGIVIESFYYEKNEKEFHAARRIPKKLDQNPTACHSVRIKTKVAANGDLEGSCEKTLAAYKGKTLPELRISFGVDPRSNPVAQFSNLNFRLFRNGSVVNASDYTVR